MSRADSVSTTNRRLFLASGTFAAVSGGLAIVAQAFPQTAGKLALRALPIVPDPVLAALTAYAQTRADASILGDAYMHIEVDHMAGKLSNEENDRAEKLWHEALDRRDAATHAVLTAKPATEEGAEQLACFAATIAEQFAEGCDEHDVRDLGAAARTLGDWLVSRRRSLVEA